MNSWTTNVVSKLRDVIDIAKQHDAFSILEFPGDAAALSESPFVPHLKVSKVVVCKVAVVLVRLFAKPDRVFERLIDGVEIAFQMQGGDSLIGSDGVKSSGVDFVRDAAGDVVVDQ